MSSDYVLVCYGVRYEMTDEEAGGRSIDPRIVQAKRAKLQWWDGAFAGGAPGGMWGNGERMFLFIGAIIGTFGRESVAAARLTDPELQDVIATTKVRLSEAGLEGEPALYVQFAPDA